MFAEMRLMKNAIKSLTGRILRPVPAFPVLSTCTWFMVSCALGINVSDHFADVRKMIGFGKGGQRDVETMHIIRLVEKFLVKNLEVREIVRIFATELKMYNF